MSQHEAARLHAAGIKLCLLQPLRKRPVADAWNTPDAFVKTVDINASGYGIPLVANGLCSIDPDHLTMATIALHAVGINLEQQLASGVRTTSTRPESGGRAAFRSMPGLSWFTFSVRTPGSGGSTTVFELRAGSANLQDCVPGVSYQTVKQINGVEVVNSEIYQQDYAPGSARFDAAPSLRPEMHGFWMRMSTDPNFRRAAEDQMTAALVTWGYAVAPVYNLRFAGEKKLAIQMNGRLRKVFNQSVEVETVLAHNGYSAPRREGGRWASPGSSGSPSIRLIPGKDSLWQSDHQSDLLNGTFDAAQASVVLDHNCDVAAFEAWTRCRIGALTFAGGNYWELPAGTPEPEAPPPPPPQPGMGAGAGPTPATDPVLSDLLVKWELEAHRVLSAYGLGAGDTLINSEAVTAAWGRCAVTGKSASLTFHMLYPDGRRKEFGRADFVDIVIPEMCGKMTTQAFESAVDAALVGVSGATERKEITAQTKALRSKPLVRQLIAYRSATEMTVEVDMFSERGRMDVSAGTLSIIMPFKPFNEGVVDAAVVDDYKQHFPQFDDVLDALLHARFATDRREAYIWLRAASDWGKGLLVKIFEDLRIATELTVGVINRIIAGDTVGLSSNELLTAWIVFVDEWKGASRELKQMNSRMSVTAKYANRVTVPLYLKVFMSAEDVSSLTGEGVEAQFNNRFAFIRSPSGRLDERALFNSVGKAAYIAALVAYSAARLNAGVARMRAMGRLGSSKESDQWLSTFHKAHLLTDSFGSLDDSMVAIAEDIKALVFNFAKIPRMSFDARYFANNNGLDISVANLLIRNVATAWVAGAHGGYIKAVVLKHPTSFVKAYLSQTGADKSVATKLSYKTHEVISLLHDQTVAMDNQHRLREYGHGAAPLGTGTQCRWVAVWQDKDVRQAPSPAAVGS